MFSFLPPNDGEKLFTKTISVAGRNLHEVATEFATSVIQSLRPTPAILSNPAQKKKWIQAMDKAHTYISERKLHDIEEGNELTREWQAVSFDILSETLK
jgi:hypothetical protein